jgi:glycerol-3-phosphate dehydrogenase
MPDTPPKGRYDVVVIGLGINGAAALRELALAGYSVLGVDMQDFGAGSSARSSRLLHCGLRYLAPGRSAWEFVRHPKRFATALKMASQAVEARNEFVRTEPHRVDAARLHFPIYQDGPYAPWQVRAAFRLLGALNVGGVPLDYSMMSRGDAAKAPMVRLLGSMERLRTVATYREYQLVWPERVCVDAVLDAAVAGATVLNYARVESCARTEQGDWSVRLQREGGQSRFEVRAPVVLNMAGIWIDEVLRTASPRAIQRVLGTKGAHILVGMPEECRSLGIATINSKGEPFYCLPWGEFHYFGPTETLYEGDKEHVVVNDAEIDFLVAEANRLFPSRRVGRPDVVHTWAGVRPLTYDKDQPLGNRKRVLHDLSSEGLGGMYALTGGPVMTHRSAGREARHAVDRRGGSPASKGDASLGQHAQVDRDFLRKLRLDVPEARERLVEIVSRERVKHLSDLFFRRLGVAWFERVDASDVQRVARAAAPALDWGEARTETAIAEFLHELDTMFGYRVAKGINGANASGSSSVVETMPAESR